MVLTAQQLEAIMPDASQLLSDEPEMESSLHYMQLLLLVTCLEWLWRERNDFFIGANLSIYFSRQQLRNRDFRGRDFFLVKQTATSQCLGSVGRRWKVSQFDYRVAIEFNRHNRPHFEKRPISRPLPDAGVFLVFPRKFGI